MATIQSTIELFDNFSAPMMDIIQAVNMGLSAMENLQQGMNQSVDTTSIDGARDALNQATEAAQALEAAMQGMDIPEQTNPVQVPVQPEIPDPIVPPSDPVTVPVQWQYNCRRKRQFPPENPYRSAFAPRHGRFWQPHPATVGQYCR